MVLRARSLFLSVAIFVAALSLSAFISTDEPSSNPSANTFQPNVLPNSSEQSSTCIGILQEAASLASVKGESHIWYDTADSEYWGCSIIYTRWDETKILENVEFFIERIEEGAVTCGPQTISTPDTPSICNQITFHDYPASATTWFHPEENTVIGYTLSWNMPIGEYFYRSGVYVGFSGRSPEPIAEVLLAVAQQRLSGYEEEIALPPVEGLELDGQPVVPLDPSDPAQTGDLFGIPALVLLGSLGVPVAGAAAGAIFSTLMSQFSSSATTAATGQTPYCRELDPDEIADFEASGLSKVEYIRNKTRANLIKNLDKEFEKFSPADQANLVELHQRMHDLIRAEKAKGRYVKNPDDDWSIPFMPSVGVRNIVNELLDPTPVGMLNNFLGGRCGEFTSWGKSWTKDLLDKTGFRGQDICVSDIELYWSPVDNHGANQLRFPGGKRVVVDYQKGFQIGKPVMRSENNWTLASSIRLSTFLLTPEIRYDGVSGNKDQLRQMFQRYEVEEIPAKFIQQAKDKAEARAILREFYDECVNENSAKNAPPSSKAKLPTKPEHSGARIPKK